MEKTKNFVIKNWLVLVLLAIILFQFKTKSPTPFGLTPNRSATFDMMAPASEGITESLGATKQMAIVPEPDFAPQPQVSDRMVIQESDMSLLVKDVAGTRDQIVSYAQENGGYMVNSFMSNPEDAPNATVVIRIKSSNIREALEYLRSLAVKVVSENLHGYDVTDQYVDIDKRIAILEQSKAQIQAILAQAREISDISNLTQQILSLQSQIDSYKGQQEALEKNADLAKITIYLSTDEIALPYAPSDTFRPEVIFKLAVRSLISDLRGLAASGIWLAVYSLIWIPVAGLGYLIIRYLKRRK